MAPNYGSTTTLTATPTNGDAPTLRPSRISSLSGWSGTALSSTADSIKDDLVVYSNIGPATRVSIPTKHSNFGNAPSTYSPPDDSLHVEEINGEDAHLIRSSAFPTVENDPKDFEHAFDPDPVVDTDNDGDTRNDYDRYRVAGTYDGASGHFECTSATCTVNRLGNRYVVTGTWKFYVPKTRTVSQDDQSHMYFGWWREQRTDGSLSFATFSGGVNSATSSTDDINNFDALGGSATYRGPAVGQYAIYQPAGSDSGAGSFTARAELTANFGTNMLSGTVTNFSNASDWSLTLNGASMEGGEVDDGGTVSWEIDGVVSSQTGEWTAEFFSEAPYGGQTPDGVAGEFDAQFDEVGRLVGAFGARK